MLQPFTCGGLKFNLSVPDDCLTQPCGLIADVHGFGMNAQIMEVHTKMAEIATAKGYIVMQPSAPGTAGTASWSASNDAQVWAILQSVMNVWHTDPKRFHFDGYSQGGWMTWRFICNHADMLASAAPIAAGAGATGNSCGFNDAEMPAREIPILHTHGRQDGLVDFSTTITERDALLAAWKMGDPTTIAGAPGTDYQWDRYTNANGTVYEFAQHDWTCDFVLAGRPIKGHCFPGSGDFLGCGATNPYIWAEKVLQFFIDHPAP